MHLSQVRCSLSWLCLENQKGIHTAAVLTNLAPEACSATKLAVTSGVKLWHVILKAADGQVFAVHSCCYIKVFQLIFHESWNSAY